MNEKREFQRSESFAAAALLALSGGLLDAYTYLCRGGVFANAQTGNMVLLAIRAAEGKWQEAGRYLIPILAFAAGVMVAETVKRLHRSAGAFHWRHTVLGLEIVLLAAAACAPLGTWDSVVNVAVSFVCALQVEAFRMATPLHPPCAPAICAAARRRCTAVFRNRRRAACVPPDVTLPSLPASSAARRWAVCCCPFWASGRCWWLRRNRPRCLCGCGFDKIEKVSKKSFRNLNCVVYYFISVRVRRIA